MTAVAAALTALMRQDRGRLLAALIARTGDFSGAEEALQEAAEAALLHWGRSGLPDHPQGWLLRVALRKSIDRYRRSARAEAHLALIRQLGAEEAVMAEGQEIADERLRLIFTCCHPALEPKTRVALTLRTVCGLTTADIAAVFLDGEPTMAQRLSRARAKIAAARIPYVVPGAEDWAARLETVLTVVYLIFTVGYTAGAGHGLCGEAIFLARLLQDLRPGDAEVEGCLALLLLTDARRAARVDSRCHAVPPGAQDAALWDGQAQAEGLALLDRAMARRAAGPFQIKAAISACQMMRPGPDWPQIRLLYDRLIGFEPTPVVRLNRAVALMECADLTAAGQEIAALAVELADYQPFHAARAEWLARSGCWAEAIAAFDEALRGAGPAEAAYLRARRADLAG